jgi:hypothetical protein
MINIKNIPLEILYIIFELFYLNDLMNLRMVNRLFNNISSKLILKMIKKKSFDTWNDYVFYRDYVFYHDNSYKYFDIKVNRSISFYHEEDKTLCMKDIKLNIGYNNDKDYINIVHRNFEYNYKKCEISNIDMKRSVVKFNRIVYFNVNSKIIQRKLSYGRLLCRDIIYFSDINMYKEYYYCNDPGSRARNTFIMIKKDEFERRKNMDADVNIFKNNPTLWWQMKDYI